MTPLDRRRFFRSLAIGAGGVAAYSCQDRQRAVVAQKAASERVGALREEDITWDKAPCRYCGTGCGVMVGTHGQGTEKKVVAVRGDTKHPVNKGLLCVKGYHLPAMLYGADRLTHPLRRKADGSGFEKVSWEVALDLIASKFKAALDDHGPAAVAMYGSGQWTIHDGYAALKWVKGGLRSNNIEANARLCMASAVTGFMTTFGSDEPMGCYDDLEAGDDFVLWGNNMAEMHPVLFSRILERKRTHPSVRIVDIATRRTPTSQYADLYVEFKPGTDLALANGILHLLVESNRIDRAFISENVAFRRGIEDVETIGYGCRGDNANRYTFKDKAQLANYGDFKTFLADYTPDKVSEITGVPVGQIKMLADMYGATSRGTVSLWCMGVNQHVRGTWMNNLINNLHLITGKISRPGAGPFSLTGQPSACGTVREVGTLCFRLPADTVTMKKEHRDLAEKIWKLPEGTIPTKPGYHTMDMFRALARGDVRAMWIQVTNPWVSLPNLARWERKHGDGRFIVVSDIYPTPTTEIADLILPSAAWVEREGAFGNSERRTHQWNKMVEPPGEAKSDTWQIVQVAKRMGMEHLFPWSNEEFHEALYEEYRQFTLGRAKDVASYQQLRDTRGQRWPVVDRRETRYRYSAKDDPYARAGTKRAGGVHFYKAKKYDDRAAVWLRPYQPPAEVPDKEYPYWLSTGRILEHWHTGSMTRRVKQLQQAAPAAFVEINRADASELGIQNGQKVRVVSRRGSLELPAQVDGRGSPPRGSVFIPFFDESLLVNNLTLDAMDNISKQPDYKKCAVRIERA